MVCFKNLISACGSAENMYYFGLWFMIEVCLIYALIYTNIWTVVLGGKTIQEPHLNDYNHLSISGMPGRHTGITLFISPNNSTRLRSWDYDFFKIASRSFWSLPFPDSQGLSFLSYQDPQDIPCSQSAVSLSISPVSFNLHKILSISTPNPFCRCYLAAQSWLTLCDSTTLAR